MLFSYESSEQFSDNDTSNFINFITEHVNHAIEGKIYCFPDNKNPKAKVEFWHSNKAEIKSLILGTSDDMDQGIERSRETDNRVYPEPVFFCCF